MFTKNVASIYFSGNSVLVSEVDSTRKKLRKAFEIKLTDKVVSGSKVADKGVLAKTIKENWNNFSLRTKDVGIVIPEFLTFTKIIKLPKLSVAEIGEAVNWQAQEYLPTGTENMVLDWKILEKSQSEIEVLLVAVSKSILMDFVDSCVLAGLFPVSVETPSTAVSKLIKNNDPYLFVLSEADSTLLVAGQGSKIMSTNIIDGKGVAQICSLAQKVARRVSKPGIAVIYVGGMGVTDQLIQSLKESLAKNVIVFDPDIDAETRVKHQYLVPISMLKVPFSEPSDPKTLNLLPGNLVGRYQNQKIRDQVWSLTLTVTVFVWVSLLAVLGSYMILTQQISDLKTELSGLGQLNTRRQELEAEATKINDIAQSFLRIKDATIFPAVILNDVFRSVPEGVSVLSYDLDLDRGVVGIRGISKDRQSLVSFKENLEKITDFESVVIPISSFEKVSDLEFSLNFQYKPLKSVVPTKSQGR